jgi:hypothetical protein
MDEPALVVGAFRGGRKSHAACSVRLGAATRPSGLGEASCLAERFPELEVERLESPRPRSRSGFGRDGSGGGWLGRQA